MQYRQFGQTGWQVSDIGYGMWGMAGWTGSDDEESMSFSKDSTDARRAKAHSLKPKKYLWCELKPSPDCGCMIWLEIRAHTSGKTRKLWPFTDFPCEHS